MIRLEKINLMSVDPFCLSRVIHKLKSSRGFVRLLLLQAYKVHTSHIYCLDILKGVPKTWKLENNVGTFNRHFRNNERSFNNVKYGKN